MIGALLGLLAPSPLGAVRQAVRPNPYAPSLPVQASFAIGQDVRAGIRAPFDLVAGSEEDWPAEQRAGRDLGGRPAQWLPGAPTPPSRFRPNLPRSGSLEGAGTGYVTGYNKGWVVLRHRLPWGWTNRGAPHVIISTLLDPRDRSPLPRAMSQAYVEQNPARVRLEDVFDTGD